MLDCTMLEVVNNMSIRQALATWKSRILANQLLDYACTYTIAILSFRKSYVMLKIHSDVSHLSAPKVRRKDGGISSLEITSQHHKLGKTVDQCTMNVAC